jgi:hypothetical protein
MLEARELSTAWFQGTQSRRAVVLTPVVAGASIVLGWLVLQFQIAPAVILLVVATVCAIAWRPRFGVYVLLALATFFEPGGEDPLMGPGVVLNNSFQSAFGATGLTLTPFELVLLFSLGIWLAKAAMQRRADYRGGKLGWYIFFFALALTFGVIRGLASGGNFNYALWESRFLFYIVLCYVLTANTIRTRAHVRTLITIFLVSNALFAIEGLWRKFALADTGLLGNQSEFWYSHEDVVLLGTAIMLVFAQQVFGSRRRWQRWLGPLLLLVMGFTMLATEHRSGYIAVMIAFVVFAVTLLVTHRRAFLIMAVPIMLAGAVYLPVFWNNTSLLGQPARAVRSLKDPDPRDASSNLARDIEAANVRATIAFNPILGVGFGQPFLIVVPGPDISFFPLWNYEAHHAVMWVWLKLGAGGFVVFWVLMAASIMRAANLARTLHEPDGRVFAIFTLSGVVIALVFSYVDLGLTGARVPIMLGTTLGTLGVLQRIFE